MSDFQRWCPSDLFSTGQAGVVCKIKQVNLTTVAGTNNIVLVGGVGAKQLKCISLRISSIAAVATTVILKNAGTGLLMSNIFPVPAINAVISNGFVDLPPNPLGHFESDLSDTIYVDTGAGAGASICFRYIEFSP